jgi:hypothetical protein
LNTLYAFVLVLSLGVAAGSLLALISRRLRRRAALVLGASVIAFVVSDRLFVPDKPPEAVATPQVEAATPQVATTAPQVRAVAPPASTPQPAPMPQSATPAPPVRDEPLPQQSVAPPGIARICLRDRDVHLADKDEVVIPASTVFEDDGPNIGKPDDPSTWRYEIKEGFKFPAQFLTLTAVSLGKGKPCADAKVEMLTGTGGTETTKRASDNHVFVIDNVLDYPIPTERPPIEIGKLIDNISVEAMLTTDVTQAVVRTEPTFPDDKAMAANCLAGARKLAAHLGGGTGQQTSMIVGIDHVAADRATYGCPFGPNQKADFRVYWKGQPQPASNTLALIGKGGEFVTGATAVEIMRETSACLTEALKSDGAEIVDREVRGVKIECHAFTREGGGGSVTIYRRFGLDPVRPELSEVAATAVDRASRDMKGEDGKKAGDPPQVADQNQDPTIPKNVKSFAMMAARVTVLQDKCPSSKSHDDKIARWASDAGVNSSDIHSGGRYASLMTSMLAQMKAEAAKQSSAEACEALKKYD